MKVILVFLLSLLLLFINYCSIVLSLECHIDINSKINYKNGECGCFLNNQQYLPPCKTITEVGYISREFIRVNKNKEDYLKLFERLSIVISDGIYYVNSNNILGDLDTFNEIIIQSYTSFKNNNSTSYHGSNSSSSVISGISGSGVYIDGSNSNKVFLSSDLNNLVGLSYSNSLIINNINFINFNNYNSNSNNNNHNSNNCILVFKSSNKEFYKISILNSSFNNIYNNRIISIINQIKSKVPIDKGNSPLFHCDYCNFTNIIFNDNNKSPVLQFNNIKAIFTNSYFSNNTILNSKSFFSNQVGIINGTNNSYYLTQFYSSTFYNNTIINSNNSFISVKNSLCYFNYNKILNNTGSIISFNGDQDQIDSLQQSNNIYLFLDNNLFSANKIIINNHHHIDNGIGLINLFKSIYDYINYRSIISNNIFQNNIIINNNNNNHDDNKYLITSTNFAIEFINITVENPFIIPSTLQNNYKFIQSKNSFVIITNSYILSNNLVCGDLSNVQIKGSKISLDFSNLHKECLNCHFSIEALDSLGLSSKLYDFNTYDTSGGIIHGAVKNKTNIEHYKLYLKIIVSLILIVITSTLVYLCFFLEISN